VLLGVETQVALHAAVAQGTGGHHLGVEQGVAGQQAVEKPTMAVGPIHHGRHGKTPALGFGEMHGADYPWLAAALKTNIYVSFL
jgi:hypothetical protein